MATRFYFSSTGIPSTSPAFSASWEQTGQAVRRTMSTTTTGSALTDFSVTVPITTTQDILAVQFVSLPLAAQSFSGASLTIIARCQEAAVGADAFFEFQVRTYRPSTGDFQSLRTIITTATEFGTTASTRGPASTYGLSAVTVEDGDLLVVEVGVNADAPSATSSALIRFGDDAGSDFAFTTGLTTDLNPWVEFTNDITFYTPVGPTNLKTYNTNPVANIKTINTNPIANVKSLNTNT